jgi:hypothetical protein
MSWLQANLLCHHLLAPFHPMGEAFVSEQIFYFIGIINEMEQLL